MLWPSIWHASMLWERQASQSSVPGRRFGDAAGSGLSAWVPASSAGTRVEFQPGIGCWGCLGGAPEGRESPFPLSLLLCQKKKKDLMKKIGN